MSDAKDTINLAVQDAGETIALADVVNTAHRLGVQHLPDVDRMTSGRVWPGGHGWVAEIGEDSNVHALDDMYESMVDGIKAVDAEIRQLREAAVNALMNGGIEAAKLATTSERWQPPVLKIYADVGQQDAWLLQLPA